MPSPEAERSCFLAFAETDLIPLTRRLVMILNQAGIPAQAIDRMTTPCGLGCSWIKRGLSEHYFRHLMPSACN
jgi:hypothetical protein